MLIPLASEKIAQGCCRLPYIGGSDRDRLFAAMVVEVPGKVWMVLHLFTKAGQHEMTEATPFVGVDARARAEANLKDCLRRKLAGVRYQNIVVEPFLTEVNAMQFGLVKANGGYRLIPGEGLLLQPLGRAATRSRNRELAVSQASARWDDEFRAMPLLPWLGLGLWLVAVAVVCPPLFVRTLKRRTKLWHRESQRLAPYQDYLHLGSWRSRLRLQASLPAFLGFLAGVTAELSTGSMMTRAFGQAWTTILGLAALLYASNVSVLLIDGFEYLRVRRRGRVVPKVKSWHEEQEEKAREERENDLFWEAMGRDNAPSQRWD